MRTIEEIKQEIQKLEAQKHIEEMADDFFYTNGKAKAYNSKLFQLRQELAQAEQN